MPLLDVTRSYLDNSPFLERYIDDFLDDIEELLNVTQLDDDNIQDASLTASTIVTAGSITTAKMISEIATTAKFAAGSVTTSKLPTGGIVAAEVADANITTDKIANTTITTALFADASLSTTEFADSGLNKSSLTASVYAESAEVVTVGAGDSGSWVVVATAPAMTTTGNPVLVQINKSSIAADSIFNTEQISTNSTDIEVRFKVDGIVIAVYRVYMQNDHASIGAALRLPISSFSFIHIPSAGSHTYSAEIRTIITGLSVFHYFQYIKLIAVELQ